MYAYREWALGSLPLSTESAKVHFTWHLRVSPWDWRPVAHLLPYYPIDTIPASAPDLWYFLSKYIMGALVPLSSSAKGEAQAKRGVQQ